MQLLGGVLRLITFVFNFLLALFLLGIGLVGLMSGEDIHFEELPGVAPESMAPVLVGLALFALLSTALSLKPLKIGRLLMVLWNLLVVSALVCDFTRPSYRFDGMEHFTNGVILFAVALLALLGGWVHLRRLSSGRQRS